jgi:ribosomal protein S6
VVDQGGIVRSIQNHGIRDLAHRFRARFPDKLGQRYFKKGRFISVYYDASPDTMRQVESVIRLHSDVVLRQTHLKARNKLWYVNVAREDRNPYIQRVMEMEAPEEEGARADGELSEIDEDEFMDEADTQEEAGEPTKNQEI